MASGDRTYSAKRAAHICAELAAGRSLREICARDPGMPAESTVRLWAVDDVDGFAARYARAREVQADCYADEINAIADQLPETIQTVRPDGTTETRRDPAYVAWQKNRIDARKWLAGKLRPKQWGDRVEVEGAVTLNIADRLDAARRRVIDAIDG